VGSGPSHHNQTRDHKSQETHDQPFPIAAGDKVESAEGNAHSQDHAAKEEKRRVLGRDAAADGPPKSTKENRPDSQAGHPRERKY
jgi:hypothetical protein